jgi:hypothetical protein
MFECPPTTCFNLQLTENVIHTLDAKLKVQTMICKKKMFIVLKNGLCYCKLKLYHGQKV